MNFVFSFMNQLTLLGLFLVYVMYMLSTITANTRLVIQSFAFRGRADCFNDVSTFVAEARKKQK
jgi:hypothetical protein